MPVWKPVCEGGGLCVGGSAKDSRERSNTIGSHWMSEPSPEPRGLIAASRLVWLYFWYEDSNFIAGRHFPRGRAPGKAPEEVPQRALPGGGRRVRGPTR